eukprot:TRINITY_DN31056_c0_g1_i4.p1 TRINITY_DN31056_c0_g1~~TRINITY_DN31056_c0_g1_i4.p1  ORF type:complete len:308 (-),score=31.83 TRINITY_DN31056_c0_g1_i4:206-1129(-)
MPVSSSLLHLVLVVLEGLWGITARAPIRGLPCWSHGFSFETCCLPEPWQNPECWQDAFAPDACCTCFDPVRWYSQFVSQKKWQKFSQGVQDSVLVSLFSPENLGSTNKVFVEFGGAVSSNTDLLRTEYGWAGVLWDIDPPANGKPALGGRTVYREFVTPQNVARLFQLYKIPRRPDLVVIDIDSCDLWVFLNLTVTYRPRVVQVEYNSNYLFEESYTNICQAPDGQQYQWIGDNLYGASLAALAKAAKLRNYSLVYVDCMLDVFLVDDDWACPGGLEVDLENFRECTDLQQHNQANEYSVKFWTVPF